MSQKVEKPSLSGHRLKTRKRDEKEKYDPSSFRDAIIQGLTETGNDLDQVAKYLDLQGGKLDFRRYADVLFDILFAGGQLAPGGSIVEDPTDTDKLYRTNVCVFKTDDSKLREFYEVFNKLLRRYKYLERSFEDALKKILYFMKGFQDDEKQKLAIITGIFLGNGFCSAKVLSSLFEEHLVKDGISLDFANVMFKSWLAERDISSIVTALKKAQIENKLLELFPVNKRDQDTFVAHFKKVGLAPIADFQDTQRNNQVKVELKKHVTEMMKDEEPPKEMVAYILEHMQKHNLRDQEVTILVWSTIMASVEWNKKEELVAEQALKHLKTYSPLLAAVAKSSKAELSLLVRIQEYCYDNMNFMKSFQKIVVMLYKTDVIGEEVILKWYKDGHSAKGKSVFLEQMKKFVEWLENASEESEDEED
ncbi:eIF5-mimic protein 2-like [Crassostrea virginica]|uniref:Basic leucine zipper and W2 domain-containing protein 1-like n=1 Tax=Crassostrea virginica TaxID=6565 RepID=A0A8B8AUM3_CRAVI|nr:basic leucine zipper and W2 domain-containing protein 1-like [Crassostrea virginica]